MQELYCFSLDRRLENCMFDSHSLILMGNWVALTQADTERFVL